MKSLKVIAGVLCVALAASSCGDRMNSTLKGGLAGTAAGGAVGTGVGALIGKATGNTKKGAIIGAAVGSAVGATAGTLIGKKMGKVKAAAKAAAAQAQVETVTDGNGLEGVKVTFDNGIMFQTGKYDLNAAAKTDLKKLADEVLKVYTDCDCNVYGFASSDGSDATNLTLSQNRANAVRNYLNSCGVKNSQIKNCVGYGENPDYLVRNADGSENMKASRRVEVYLYASEAMIKAAEAGTLK